MPTNDPLIQSALREFRDKLAKREFFHSRRENDKEHGDTIVIVTENEKLEAWLSSTLESLLHAQEKRIREAGGNAGLSNCEKPIHSN